MEPLSNNGINRAVGHPRTLGGSVDIISNGTTHACYPQMEFGLKLSDVGATVGFSSNYKTLFVLATASQTTGYYVCVYVMDGAGWTPSCYTYIEGVVDNVELSCITVPYALYLVVKDGNYMTAYTVEGNVTGPLSINLDVTETANATHDIYQKNAGAEDVEELKVSAMAYMTGEV